MQFGMIGLGRMGADMLRRLVGGGHEGAAYDIDAEAVEAVTATGVFATTELSRFVSRLTTPRAIWMMVPAAVVDPTLDALLPLLAPGDVVIDGGNSWYRDDIRRAERLSTLGLHYVDCGTSGGIFGRERGYCLMIGGEEATIRRLDPIFATLAPGREAAPPTPGRPETKDTADRGYLHCGPAGAGHFVKMVHNGIEYGLMAAYAEGLNILKHAGVGLDTQRRDAETAPLRDPAAFRYRFDLAAVTEVWRRGSVISSWLLDLTAAALARDPTLDAFSGRVSDSGEGRWTLEAAIEEGVPAHVLSAALFSRFASRGAATFQDQVLSAMRHQFGGHAEPPASK